MSQYLFQVSMDVAPEKEDLFKQAPELGDYVCRFCGDCAVNGFDPQTIFSVEAMFDRQMDDQRVDDSAQYALRERLKHWFGQKELAQEEYASLKQKVDTSADYSDLSSHCPYGINVDRKLKIAHAKLTPGGIY